MSADPGPLAGRAVVICRPTADAGSLVERCEELGATTLLMPLFDVVEARDGGVALAAALDNINRYQWLALTSVNGARAVVAGLAGRRLLPESLRVAAVGTATAGALLAAGIAVDLVPPRMTAADLAMAFPPAGGDETVLAPLAERASADLTDGLHRRGYHVHRVEAYRITPRPADPALIDGADVAIVTSPSIAARFASTVPAHLRPPSIVCIGPSTAATATDEGLTGLVVADPHNEDGVVVAVVAACEPGRADPAVPGPPS